MEHRPFNNAEMVVLLGEAQREIERLVGILEKYKQQESGDFIMVPRESVAVTAAWLDKTLAETECRCGRFLPKNEPTNVVSLRQVGP